MLVMGSVWPRLESADWTSTLETLHLWTQMLGKTREWVHLRLCLTCGQVGCCDDSPHKHATKHFHATRHPVIRSFEPGEEWAWCFPDEAMVESLRALPGEAAPRHYPTP